MKYLILSLAILGGCVSLSTDPARCIPVAEAAAKAVPAQDSLEYSMAQINAYETAFKKCANK